MDIKKLKEEIKNISEPRRTKYGNICQLVKKLIFKAALEPELFLKILFSYEK